MEILKQWKSKGGKGTYIPEDNTDSVKVVNYLISTISKMNEKIVCYATESNVAKYSAELQFQVKSHASGIIPNNAMFLLILLDIDLIPRDILTIILSANPHKYLFCTATNVSNLAKCHIELAPLITRIDQPNKEKKISSFGTTVYNVAIDLNSDDQKLYNEYSVRMNDIYSFFDGNYETINNCYRGNSKTGITADVYRREFAKLNNWSSDMDTSIEYYAEVDKHYNPNSIYEKAKLYNELLALRNHFIDEHNDKIYVLHKLIEYHNTKRYLIVCRNNYMADKVNEFLNKHNKCKNFAIHNELNPTNFKDDNNEIILYKSGDKKGQPRDFGAKLQIDAYTDWFNKGLINVLIATNAIPKDLILKDLDIIVYLSPRSLSYQELNHRVKIDFKNNAYMVNIYFIGTKDEELMRSNQKILKYPIKNYYKGDIGKLIFD